MMRRLFVLLLLALSLSCFAALAEEPTAEPAPTEPVLTAPAPLPAEHQFGGYEPNPAGFVKADESNGVKAGYYDESLSITLETVVEDGVTYRLARVKIADPSQLRTGFAKPDKSKSQLPQWNDNMDKVASQYNAVLAISADMLNRNKNGYLFRMGVNYRKQDWKSRDWLAIDQNGDFHVVFKALKKSVEEKIDLMEKDGLTVVNSFIFGPVLVHEGKALKVPSYYGVGNLKKEEPRCAIGQVGKLEYLLVIAEGRTGGVKGVKVETLAEKMAEWGCVTAFNLDGGDSAMMWFGDDFYSRKTTRTQTDIIYIATAIPQSEDATPIDATKED